MKNKINGLDLKNNIGICDFDIQLHSNKELLLEGKCSVLQYTDCLIKFSLRKKQLCIKGFGLILKTLEPETAVVCGNITAIELNDAEC